MGFSFALDLGHNLWYNRCMREIPLSQSKVARVDNADYDLVSQHTWSAVQGQNTWYAHTNIRVNGKHTILVMHRLILGLEPSDKKHTDHVDHNGLNNQRTNIRVCSRSQNAANSQKHKDGRCKYKGVCYNRGMKRVKRWWARIVVDYKTVSLGYFKTAEQAAMAYDLAAMERFGEYAYCNFF